MFQFFRLALAALVLASLPHFAEAGSWSRLNPENRGDCSLLFEGPIEKGDLTSAVDAGL